jgi:salicylate hydroxylase
MTSSKPFTVAVIGGGIAGVTLAIALLARNIDVNLYERGADFKEIGAGIGLGTNTIKAMTICNPVIKKAFDKVATSSGVPGKETVWFDFLDGVQQEPGLEPKAHVQYPTRGRRTGLP